MPARWADGSTTLCLPAGQTVLRRYACPLDKLVMIASGLPIGRTINNRCFILPRQVLLE